MWLLRLPEKDLERLGALLTSGGVLSLALTCTTGLHAFHVRGLWSFGSLRLDGERAHSPEGVFGAVVVEEIVSLSIANLGVQLFKELARWPFDKLRHLEFTDCLFESLGAEVVASLLERHRVRGLALRRCFLEGADLTALAAAAAPLERLALAEPGLKVAAGGELASLLRGSRVHDLSLQGRFELGDEALAALVAHAPLRSLRLVDNALLSDATVLCLCEGLASRSAPLALLDFSASAGGCLTDAAGAALGRLLATTAGPRVLRVAGHRLTRASVAACLASGGGLGSADFAGNDLGAGSGDDELASAAASSRLQALRVGGGHGGGAAPLHSLEDDEAPERTPLRSLAWLSGLLPSLVLLDVSHAQIDDAALAAFAAAMAAAEAVALRDLDLSGNFITEDGAVALIGGLRLARARLTRLDLGVNHLGDDGCKAVGDALLPGAALASLQELSLRANAVGDVSTLCAGLRAGAVRELDLRENLLTDADVRRLLAEVERRGRGGAGGLVMRLGGNELCEEEWEDLETCRGVGGAAAVEPAMDVAEDLFPHEIRVSNLSLIGPDPECRIGTGKAELSAHSQARPKAETAKGDAKSETDNGTDGAKSSDDPCGGNSEVPASDGVSVDDGWGGPALGKALLQPRGGAETPPSPSAWGRPWEGSAPAVSREEWQDCLDTLAWMESCIQK